jgi:hypothetical protein
MKINFTPPVHNGCHSPRAIECECDVREWVALTPECNLNPIFLNVEQGFCDNYPVGTVTIELIRKYNRYKGRAIYITLPNGDECQTW